MSGVDLRRLRPTPATLAALIGALIALFTGAARELIWEDLRGGVMRIKDLPRGTRAIVRGGFVVLFALVVLLLFADVLRGSSELLTTSGGAPARGAHFPVALFPLTLFMFSLAWAFMLTGALHAHVLLRVIVVAVYLGMTLNWVMTGEFFTDGWTDPDTLRAFGIAASVPLFLVVASFLRPRVWLEFTVLLVLICATYLNASLGSVDVFRATGIAITTQSVGFMAVLMRGFVTPLLVVAGIDVADFIYRSSGWGAGLARERFPRAVLYVALAGVAAWRLVDTVRYLIDFVGDSDATAADLGVQFLGASVIIILVFLVWFLVERVARPVPDADLVPDDIAVKAQGTVPKVAVAYYGWMLLSSAAFIVILGVLSLSDGSTRSVGRISRWIATVNRLTDRVDVWHLGLDVLMIVIAVWALRRGRRATALFLGVLATTDLWFFLVNTGRPLEFLGWDEFAQLNALWTIVFAVAAVIALVRRRLDADRAQNLLLLFLVSAFLSREDVIGDPFTPVFAFAGIAFVAFGIVWGAVTSGSWANDGSPRLPRVSRIFLYLGYTIISVTIINWSLASHDLEGVAYYTGEAASQGFRLFGKPLLYALFVVLLLRSTRPAPSVAGAGLGGMPDPEPPLAPPLTLESRDVAEPVPVDVEGVTTEPPPEQITTTTAVGRIRVYELARELGMSSAETIEWLRQLDVEVSSHASSVEAEDAERLRQYISELGA